MRYRKSKLKRKLQAKQKAALTTEEQLKTYTLYLEAEAKKKNATLSEVYTAVAAQAGDDAYKVFSYTDWKLSRREKAERLHAMYHGSKQEPVEPIDPVEMIKKEITG